MGLKDMLIVFIVMLVLVGLVALAIATKPEPPPEAKLTEGASSSEGTIVFRSGYTEIIRIIDKDNGNIIYIYDGYKKGGIVVIKKDE